MTNRKPNFATALRMLDLLLALDQRRYGWPVAEAAEALEVDRRTIKRYVEALGSRLVTEDGRPAIIIVHHDRQPCIMLNRPVLQFETGVFEQAALHLGSRFLDTFLPGSGLEEALEQVKHDLAKGIAAEPLATNPTMGQMSQKLVIRPPVLPVMPPQEVMTTLISGLVRERQVLLRYLYCEDIHVVEPLSLCLRGQHCELIVRSPASGDILTLDPVTIQRSELGKRFEYPQDWKPE